MREEEISLITKELTKHKNDLVLAVTRNRPKEDIGHLETKVRIKESILSVLKGEQDGVIKQSHAPEDGKGSQSFER